MVASVRSKKDSVVLTDSSAHRRPQPAVRASSSFSRMLGLVDLFTEREPARTIDSLIAATGYKRATLYRYVRELCKAGLLVKLSASLYALGPRFIEIDRQIRASDPLLRIGQPLAADLFVTSGHTIILCSLLRDSVMCIHLQRASDVPAELGHDRGRALPLFRSASAKAILAGLPAARLRRLYQAFHAEIRGVGLGRDWEAFKEHLRAIRRAGYAESRGELVAGLIGLAVPVFNPDGEVLASLAFVIPESKLDAPRREFLVGILARGADRMRMELGRLAGAPNTAAEGATAMVRRSRRNARATAQGV